MNLSFLSRLGATGSGFFQGQDEMLRRQMLMQQMQQQRTQQQGMAALANAYASGGGMAPGPQMPTPPMPGQPSPQPPQGGPQGPAAGGPMPTPLGMPPGASMGPQRGPVGMPPPMGMPQPPKPYTAPQPPQPPQQTAQQAPGQITPPPQVAQAVQSTLPDLQTMAKKLKDQGITGPALFAALQQHSQFLNADGKRELALLQQQVRELQAQAAVTRAGAAQTTAATGQQREARMEAGAEGQTAMSAAKIALMKAQALRQQELAIRGPAAGRPARPKVFTSEDGKMYSYIVTPDGAISVRDQSGRPVTDDQNPTPVTPGQQTMRNTVKLDISELDYALDNMKKAGPDATASVFFDQKGEGGITRWRNNELTPEEYQQYDVYANRIATAVASVQSMGRGQISDEKVAQARKLVPAPGDAPATVQTKLAALQRLRDQSNQILQNKSPDQIKGDATSKAPAADKPKPTAADRAWAKAHPEDAAKFKAHFGVDP